MINQTIPTFNVIGISVRTTNENGQSGQDIPALWNKFMVEGFMQKIPNKVGDDLYCIYTDYEKNHTKPYTTILGCKVVSLEKIPDGMVGKTILAALYTEHVVKGNLQEGIVFNEWQKIWKSDLQRTFTADFEVYGENARDPASAEVNIFIAVK